MTFDEIEGEVQALLGLENVVSYIIGRSIYGRAIYAFHVGSSCGQQIIVTGAIHAREWITALLVVELVKIYSSVGVNGGGIYFVPLCNPDGVEIALGGESLWKANARGVDLNVNFDADWGFGAQNVRAEGAENFIGVRPGSEPEVRALIDFAVKIGPQAVVAYHSKGEVIYHGFEPARVKNCGAPAEIEDYRKLLSRTLELSMRASRVCGYEVQKTERSAGGFSDWVMMHLKVPAITIEVGNDEYTHPIGVDRLQEILMQNKKVPAVVMEFLNGDY